MRKLISFFVLIVFGATISFAQEAEKTAQVREAPKNITPNMKYVQYKHLYKAKMYVGDTGKLEKPDVATICSFFLPGLGQMICGEGKRGTVYLVSSTVLTAAGGFGAAKARYSNEAKVLMYVGLAGSGIIWICSIVDANRVAKIKHMYTIDVRNMTSFNIDLEPYIDCVAVGNNLVTPVGLSLVVSF